jgi:CMP-N-acetylneuraminic acid synthetase
MHEESLAEKKFITSLATGYFTETILSIDFDDRKEKMNFLDKPYNQYQLRACRGWSIRMRPRLLRDDSVDVVLDALDYVGADDDDFYYLLQPTSPFLRGETIFKAINAVQAYRAYGDCTVVTVNPAYKPNGGLYAGKVRNLRKYWNFYEPNVVPLVLDWRESMDIDEEHDFQIARSLME